MKKYAPRFGARNDLIPALAKDLVAQLEGHEADPALADAVREVQSIYKNFTPITAEQFENMMRLIARGAGVRCRWDRIRVEGSGIAPPILCRYLANIELRGRFDAARLHWKTYREWSALDVEEILDALAHGGRTLQSTVYARGGDLGQYRRLLRLIARAPEVEQRYFQAKRVQQARIGDQLLEELGEISTRKEGRAICRRMDLLRRRMPHKIRETFRPERTPVELARRRAGLRRNGKARTGVGSAGDGP